MAKKKNPRINWSSGDISGSQVIFGDGNNVIQGQGNRIQQAKFQSISRAELKELQSGFENLKAQIEASAPPEKKDEALQKAGELQQAVLNKKPDPSKMASVRDWFLGNAPGLAGAVTGMVINPIVGKLVEAAGDLVAGQFKQLFSDSA